MDEFTLFSSKLKICDLIVLTPADESRTYCRFYSNGLYQDRMFISDNAVKESLSRLSSEEDVIDWNGVQHLRAKYCLIEDKKESSDTIQAASVNELI